jgi:hypothetical protein
MIERDPREWVILEEDEKRVVFVTGKGIKIRTSKKGTIYQEWLKEMTRIADGGPVVEMEEGEAIEPVWMMRNDRFSVVERPASEAIPTQEDQEKKAQRKLDNLELSELHRRLEQLRAELRDRLWCQHEKDFCSGSCKIIERIRELEKQCLGGRE